MAEEKNHIHYPDEMMLAPCGGVLLDSDVFEIKEVEDREYVSIKGGGSTSDYELLTNKPKINGNELIGDKASDDLGITDKVWEFNVTGVAPSFSSDKTLDEIKTALADGYDVVCNYGGFKFRNTKNDAAGVEFGGAVNIVRPEGLDDIDVYDVAITSSGITVDKAVVGMTIASETKIGGVKVGEGLEIDTNGVLSVADPEAVYFTVEGTLDGSGNVAITTLWADLEEAYSDSKEIRLLLNGNKEVAFAGREGGAYKFNCDTGDGLNVTVETIALTQDASVTTKIAADRAVTALKDDAPFIVVASNDDTVNKKYGTFTDVSGTAIGIAQVGQALDEGRDVILKVAIPEASLNTVDFRIERIYANGTNKNIFFYAVNDITDSNKAIRRITMSTDTSIHGQYIDYVIPDGSNNNCVITFTNSGGTITPPSDPAKWTELEEAYTTGRFIEGSMGNEKLTFARKDAPNTYVFTKESLVKKLDEAGRESYEQFVTEIKWDGTTPCTSVSGNANEFATFVVEVDGTGYAFVDPEALGKFNALNHQRVALVYGNALYMLNGYASGTDTYTFSRVVATKDEEHHELTEESFKLNASSGAISFESVDVTDFHIVPIKYNAATYDYSLQGGWNFGKLKKCISNGDIVYLEDEDTHLIYKSSYILGTQRYKFDGINMETVDGVNMLVHRNLFISDSDGDGGTTLNVVQTNMNYTHRDVVSIKPDKTIDGTWTSASINTANANNDVIVATYNGNIYQLVNSTPTSAQFVAVTYDNTKGEFTDHYIYVNGSDVAVVDKPRLECIPVIRYKTNTGGVAHAGFYPVYATEVLNQTNTYKFIAEDLPTPVDPAGVKTFVAWHIDSEAGDVATAGNAILDDVVLYAEWEV